MVTASKPDKFFLFSVVGIAALLAAGSTPRATAAEPNLKTVPYKLTDIGFEFYAPEGFKLQRGVWYHPELNATFHFGYSKGASYDKIIAEFTPEAVKASGQELRKTEEVKVNDVDGTLITVANESKGVRKIGRFVVFADDEGVCQVSVITRQDSHENVHKALRAALLTMKRTHTK